MTFAWDLPDFDAHEGVHLFQDESTGLRAIIAVHSTHLGPAAGGTRFWHYADDEDALVDALRLSRGMSYKNAMAGLALGGGKGVILADGNRTKTADMLRAYGRAIDSLSEKYVTAEDVGISPADMIEIRKETPYVSGLPVEGGQAGGDPGPYTARGVFLGVEAAAKRALGVSSLSGVHVAVQGVGSVGGGLVRHLARAGARISLADIDNARAEALANETGASVVGLNEIMTLDADILSPCALGAILNQASISALNVAVVAGGANNQLATAADAQRIHDRGILYAPDYVINAGGIINVGLEYLGAGDAAAVNAKIDEIPARLEAIWTESAADDVPSADVADRQAQALIGRG